MRVFFASLATFALIAFFSSSAHAGETQCRVVKLWDNGTSYQVRLQPTTPDQAALVVTFDNGRASWAESIKHALRTGKPLVITYVDGGDQRVTAIAEGPG
jgi:hypothetical protein